MNSPSDRDVHIDRLTGRNGTGRDELADLQRTVGNHGWQCVCGNPHFATQKWARYCQEYAVCPDQIEVNEYHGPQHQCGHCGGPHFPGFCPIAHPVFRPQHPSKRLPGVMGEPEQSPASASSRFMSLSDFLNQPPLVWLIHNMLTKGGLGALFGPPGHYKSALAIHLALCVAFGVPFYPDYDCIQGAVGYIAAEGAAGLPARIRAWLAYHQVADGHLPPIHFLRAAPQLMQLGETSTLIEQIETLGVPLVLLIVDTYSRTALGLDENHSKDVMQYVAGLERIQRATGAHVLPIGHTGWNIERERGSTALRAAVDTAMLVTKDDSRVTLSCLKMKDAADFPELTFEARPVADSFVLVPLTDEERRRAPATLPPNRQKALDALKNADEGGGVSFTKWCETSGIGKSSFNRCKDDLVSWGLIRKAGKKYEAA